MCPVPRSSVCQMEPAPVLEPGCILRRHREAGQRFTRPVVRIDRSPRDYIAARWRFDLCRVYRRKGAELATYTIAAHDLRQLAYIAGQSVLRPCRGQSLVGST